ncbi:MAG: precorrin-6y C5,15-methyltransferase (decarboxylating), CbiE subunit,precorrin-6Y [Planctomycetota bacterium]|nr:precorrin-6y C5,15-methyltransferase (decarboxylating), CbiE subunit,precorrin-6Y [Planctomycetota bacterium]
MGEPHAKIVIVGIGDDGLSGLTESAKKTVLGADVVLGAEATLRLLADLPGRKVTLDPEMTAALRQVREALSARAPVLVNYGDPLFYGVARYLCDRLGKDQFEVVPHVSSMQLAFARVKESWEDAYLTSLAGRPIESVIDRIRTAEKVGLFSSDAYPPARLAQSLLDHGIDYFRAYVCENLGQPDERVTQAELPDLVEMDFDPLHVLILVRKPNRPDRAAKLGRYRLFGNPDDVFAQSQPKRELITQAEVRSIALAQLDIRPTSIVWDIGAGSGSVSIEAAQLASLGTVFAIEPDPGDLALIAANAESFGVPNVRPIPGRAPEALSGLPDPDAIFIGGTGRQVEPVLKAAYDRLVPGGRLALNVAAIDSLAAAHKTLKELAGEVLIWNIAVSRGIDQMERVRFQAVNPTFLLAVAKRAEPGD